MTKGKIIGLVVTILLLALLGFIVYTFFRTVEYHVHSHDEFLDYDYVEFTEFKTKDIDSKSIEITTFDERYLGPDTIGNNYLFIADEVNDKTITKLSVSDFRYPQISYCKGFNLRNTYIQELGQYSFLDWQFMEFLLLPDTLITIEDFFLYNCPYLTTLQFNTTEPPTMILDNSFVNCVRLVRIEVPLGSEAKYRAVLPEKFQNCVVGVEKYERITDNTGTEKPYIRGYLNKELRWSVDYAYVEEPFTHYGYNIDDVYPVFTFIAGPDFKSFYVDLNLNRASISTCYDILVTAINTGYHIVIGNKEFDFECTGDLSIFIEFKIIDSGYINDSINIDRSF